MMGNDALDKILRQLQEGKLRGQKEKVIYFAFVDLDKPLSDVV